MTMPSERVLDNLRRFLLGVSLLMFAGTIVELWLLDHTQDAVQLIPFALCAAGIGAVAAAMLRPSRASMLSLRVLAGVEALGSLVGIGYHVWSNFSFEQEIRPTAALDTLILPTLKGAAPLIAPGALLFAALVAAAATYYHPALSSPSPLSD